MTAYFNPNLPILY